MPLKKLTLKPGINRENTRYTSENGWYEGDKIRFRQGTPEKIGGWQRISSNTFLGICRTLWSWVTALGEVLTSVGTNLKFYIENGGIYYDITPIRSTSVINNNPFALTGSTTVTVTDTSHGCSTGDFVTFSGAVDIGGAGPPPTNVTASVLNTQYQVTVINANSYTIQIAVTPNATAIAASPGGGSNVTAAYQVNVGPSINVPLSGWGSGVWSSGYWGISNPPLETIRLWNSANYGEDLIFGHRDGSIYYWDKTLGLNSRGVLLSSLGGTITVSNVASPATFVLQYAYTNGTGIKVNVTSGGSLPTGLSSSTQYYIQNISGLSCQLSTDRGGSSLVGVSSSGSGLYISELTDVPIIQNFLLVSDSSRFTFAFGANDYDSAAQNSMLIRWSGQDDVLDWYPSSTNQAGSLLLSHGSSIICAIQVRQEVLVWTDTSLYSLQYLQPPIVWGSQLMGDNLSIVGQNGVAFANGIAFWMGLDKFYAYDGRVQTLSCDLRQFVFTDTTTKYNQAQKAQIICGTNEGFNEVWWFYPSQNSTVIDTYVVYNYIEKIWYYGFLGRTAWLDSGLRPYPTAATYNQNLVEHEVGINDNSTENTEPIEAYISSAEFDIDDGYKVGFVWRVLPDITFRGSAATNPSVTMTLKPMQNSGSGYNDPESLGGISNASVTRTATIPIEQFTGQINTRVRGRQLVMEIRSTALDVQWQLGSPRLDIRPDGRR